MVPSKNVWVLLSFIFGVISPTLLRAESGVEILYEEHTNLCGVELDGRRARALDESDDRNYTDLFSSTNRKLSDQTVLIAYFVAFNLR